MKRTLALLLCALLVLSCGTAFAFTPAGEGVYNEDVISQWPERVQTYLRYFVDVTQVPHPSHNEEKLAAYLVEWADSLGLESFRDESNNVMINLPATEGYEEAPTVIMQCHIDMVRAVDEGVEFDFENDPLNLLWTDNTLKADGTSLGADNGTGIAACMYFLTCEDEEFVHGPMRFIFTTCEEDGLLGAAALDAAWLEGATYMLNVDGGYGGAVISCAGGNYFVFEHAAEMVDLPEGYVAYALSFRGLKGGHSAGVGGGKANALVATADALTYLKLAGVNFNLVSFAGGNAMNAIPSASDCVIALAEGDLGAAEEAIAAWAALFDESYKAIETEYTFAYGPAEGDAPAQVLEQELGYSFLNLMITVPNGIHTLLATASGTESSSNLGMIDVNQESISFRCFMRSSNNYQTLEIQQINATLAEMAGFELSIPVSFATWPLKADNRLGEIASEVFFELTGEEYRLSAIHAGVECGEFAVKNPALDIISTGVSGGSAGHTTAETLTFDLIDVSLDFLQVLIGRLAAE